MTSTEESKRIKHNLLKGLVIVILIVIVMMTSLRLAAKEEKHRVQTSKSNIVVHFNKSNNCKRNQCCITNYSQNQIGDYNDVGCSVQCRHFNAQTFNLSATLENTIKKYCRNQLIYLDIQSIVFQDGIINPGWLYSNQFLLHTLTINSRYIKNMSPKSFTGYIFGNLSVLCLKNLNLTYLDKGFFDGLENLKELYIFNSTLQNVDKNATFGIRKNLEVLQICKSVLGIEYFTGSFVFDKLSSADLSDNAFERVKKDSFAGLVNCKKFNLSNCSISQIDSGAFKDFKNLNVLSLENNKLTHLPEDAFSPFHNKSLDIKLSGNPWICNCNLKWLQDYIFKMLQNTFHYTIHVKIPLCAFPMNASFTSTEFCPSTTTDENRNDSTTESINLTTGTPFSPNLTCRYNRPSNMSKNSKSCDCLFDLIMNQSIFNHDHCDEEYSVSYPTTKYLSEIEENKKLKIKMPDTVKNCAALWYKLDKEQKFDVEPFCELGLNETFHIDNLIPGEMYALCVYSDRCFNELSPFDCRGYKLPLNDTVWIENGKKELYLSLYCIYLVVICIFGGIILYIIMRCNPGLLKGSKRVEIVKIRTISSTDNFINKYTSEENTEHPSSTMSHQCSRRNMGIRSLSETSVTSYSSYVSAAEPRHSMGWRKEDRKLSIKVVSALHEPPVLPPRSMEKNVEENHKKVAPKEKF